VLAGGFKDINRTVDVVAVDCLGVHDALTDARLSGLMIEDVDPSEEVVDEGRIGD